MRNAKYLIIALLLTAISATAQTQTVNAGFNKVITAYLGIKDALVADNSTQANDKAKEFTGAVKQLNANTLNNSQKTTWLAYAEKLRFDGDHISETDKLAHQREHFTSLSKNMLALVKAFKANNITLYEQYCPMKKASWLSQTTAIHNPYYGKQMDDCGSVKQTLKAN